MAHRRQACLAHGLGRVMFRERLALFVLGGGFDRALYRLPDERLCLGLGRRVLRASVILLLCADDFADRLGDIRCAAVGAVGRRGGRVNTWSTEDVAWSSN
jgi:hypothetical protein